MAAVLPSGVIVWVNHAWRRRAEEYRVAGPITGTSYFGAITPPLRAYFEQAFAESCATNTIFELDYECPTPEEQRTFHLRALPIVHGGDAGLLVEHSLVVSAPAGPGEPYGEPYVEEHYRDARGMTTQCSNCRRVYHPATAAWHWVPDLVKETRPGMSHGLCPSCIGFFWATTARRRGENG